MSMSRNQWKMCCLITVITCALWMKWGSDHHTSEWDKLNDNYIAEQKIVDQMEQVIADKNMEIDELNAQIKQLKEVK